MEKNWLQLSDLHFVKDDTRCNIFQSTILAQCKDHSFQGKHVDFVVITGDYRNFGDKTNSGFELARNFLGTLINEEHLNLNPETELFMIPGNHDMNRDTESLADDQKNRSNEIMCLLPDGYDDVKSIRFTDEETKENAEKKRRLDEYLKQCETLPSDVLVRLDEFCREENRILQRSFSVYEEKLVKWLTPGIYSSTHPASVHVRTFTGEAGVPLLNIIHLNTAIAADGRRCHYQFADVLVFSEKVKEMDTSRPAIVIAHNSFYDMHPAVRERLCQLMEQANVWAWISGDVHRRNKADERATIDRRDAFSEHIAWPNIVCSKTMTDEKDDYSDFGLMYYSWDANIVAAYNLLWDKHSSDKEFTVQRARTFSMNEYGKGSLTNYLLKKLKDVRAHYPGLRLMKYSKELVPLAAISAECSFAGKTVTKTLKELFEESWENPVRNHIYLEGVGGIGKTVTLLSLALEDGFLPYLVPAIYIPLRDLSTAEKDPIYSYIFESVCDSDGDKVKEIRDLMKRNWMNGPSFILLLDGFNEVKFENRSAVKESIEKWARQPGIQIVTTSRLDGAFSEDGYSNLFRNMQLLPLSRETVRDYLKNAAEVPVPRKDNSIWSVINLPLMLMLYINAKESMDRYRNKWLSWDGNDSSGAVIWNYLQTEIQRFRESYDDKRKWLQAVCLLEYIAPCICWQMVKEQEYEISEGQYRRYFASSLIWFEKIVSSSKEERFETLKAHYEKQTRTAFDFRTDVFGASFELEQMISEEINLFCRKEKNDGNYFCLMHQNFRDCLAAIYLIKQIGCLGEHELDDWKDKYISRDVLSFAAELMDKEKADYLWNINRTSVSADSVENILNFEQIYQDGDLAALNFSGMNLENVFIPSYSNERATFFHRLAPESLNGTRLSKGTLIPVFTPGCIASLEFSPDGKTVFLGCFDIYGVDFESGVCLGRFNNGEIFDLRLRSFSNGTWIVKAHDHDSYYFWVSKDVIDPLSLISHIFEKLKECNGVKSNERLSGCNFTCCVIPKSAGIPDFGYSSDGTIFSLLLGSTKVKVYSAEGTISEIDIDRDNLRSHFQFHYIDSNIIVASEDHSILKVFYMDRKKVTERINVNGIHYNSITVSPDGQVLVAGMESGKVFVYNLKNSTSYSKRISQEDILYARMFPMGSKCLLTSRGMSYVFDYETGTCLWEQQFYNESNELTASAISPDCRKYVLGNDAGNLMTGLFNTEKRPHIINTCHDYFGIIISPNGKWCAFPCVSGLFHIVSLIADEPLRPFVHGIEGVRLVFSSDSKQIVSYSHGEKIKVWEIETGRLIYEIEPDGNYDAVSFDKDNKRLIVGYSNKYLKTYKIKGERHEELAFKAEGDFSRIYKIIPGPEKDSCTVIHEYDFSVWNLNNGKNHLLFNDYTHWTYDQNSFAITNNTVVFYTQNYCKIITNAKERMKKLTQCYDSCILINPVFHEDNMFAILEKDELQIINAINDEIVRKVNIHHRHKNWEYFLFVNPNQFIRKADNGNMLVIDIDKKLETEIPFSYERYINIDNRISPDRRFIVSNFQGEISILDLKEKKERTYFPLTNVDVSGVDFSKAIMDDELREILRQNGAIVDPV